MATKRKLNVVYKVTSIDTHCINLRFSIPSGRTVRCTVHCPLTHANQLSRPSCHAMLSTNHKHRCRSLERVSRLHVIFPTAYWSFLPQYALPSVTVRSSYQIWIPAVSHYCRRVAAVILYTTSSSCNAKPHQHASVWSSALSGYCYLTKWLRWDHRQTAGITYLCYCALAEKLTCILLYMQCTLVCTYNFSAWDLILFTP